MRTRLIAVVGFALLGGCTDMKDQPRYEPLEETTFFEDGRSARMLVEGTVARDHLYADDHLHRGLDEQGRFATEFPFPVTEKVLARGQGRYDIFCSPCHAQTGAGDGMIVRRGYKRPSSFHTDRLRAAEPGYIFDVISNGFGDMSSYASQVRHADRWAIVAYIRALQLSGHTPVASVPADVQQRLARGERVDIRSHPEEDAHGDAGH